LTYVYAMVNLCQQQPIHTAKRSDDVQHGPQRLIARIIGFGMPKKDAFTRPHSMMAPSAFCDRSAGSAPARMFESQQAKWGHSNE